MSLGFNPSWEAIGAQFVIAAIAVQHIRNPTAPAVVCGLSYAVPTTEAMAPR